MQSMIYYHLRKIYQVICLCESISWQLKKKITGTQIKHKEMKFNLLIQFLQLFPSVQYLCRLQDLGWGALYQWYCMACCSASKEADFKAWVFTFYRKQAHWWALSVPFHRSCVPKGTLLWLYVGSQRPWMGTKWKCRICLLVFAQEKKFKIKCFGHTFQSLDHRSAAGKVWIKTQIGNAF